MTTDVALFMHALTIGGVERMRLNIAGGFVDAGLKVDLVLMNAHGPLASEVPDGVRIVDLKAPRMLAALPALVRYFRTERPTALLSALDYANLIALWARRLSRAPSRVYIGTHKVLSVATADSTLWREKHVLPRLLRHAYPWADGIVGVSDGISDDLAETLGLPRDRITTINNPALTDRVLALSEEPVDHPWFSDPEIAARTCLSVGRLHRQKDFPTLLRALAKARQNKDLRLVILGEGEERPALEALRAELGLQDVVDLPGFSLNPWAYMRRAGVFVSSSSYEGFGNVHVEALGCGCPVVSTDSPSGPADILENGRIGPLVGIGDADGLATAILDTLNSPPDKEMLRARGRDFHVDKVIQSYRALMQL